MTTFTEQGPTVHLAEPETPPECHFVGRSDELRLCKAAFGVSPEGHFDEAMAPLHFRLEGPPGVGKNEIVYELARQLARTMNLNFYSIQGHEEMTPEDLSLLVVPDPNPDALVQFRLQASPLATALSEGGLFFFDEINRLPERALAPLASVLDRRQSLYSAATGITIKPNSDAAKSRFRFCCALNPSLGETGRGVLPDYIDERTIPVIRVAYHDIKTLREILSRNLTSDQSLLDGFEEWYRDQVRVELSVRQVMALASYAIRTVREGETFYTAVQHAAKYILRPEQMEAKRADELGETSSKTPRKKKTTGRRPT